MSAPVVSVVIGVRNGEGLVESSLRSVLEQSVEGLEVVVVDDGSRDATREALHAAAERDARVRVLEQPASGLTAALIAGCGAARGRYIARLDAGDRMLVDRLRVQQAWLDAHPDTALLASGYRLLGPEGELLLEASDGPGVTDLSASFCGPTPRHAEGVAHFTVMFHRASYLACGGYRRAFRIAQDVDLWLRLAEQGRILREDRVRTEARVSLHSLSPRLHGVQIRLREVALAAARARRAGHDESVHLRHATALCASAERGSGLDRQWQAAYFVAACLEQRQRYTEAARYYRMALAHSPLAPRPRFRLIRLAMLGRCSPCG